MCVCVSIHCPLVDVGSKNECQQHLPKCILILLLMQQMMCKNVLKGEAFVEYFNSLIVEHIALIALVKPGPTSGCYL